MKTIKYEMIMWFTWFLKRIPGFVGCKLRNLLLPCKLGNDVLIWDNVHIDNPSKLTVGNRVSINRGSVINAGGEVTIGDDVLIGPNVTIYSQNHVFSRADVPFNNQGYSYSPVIIGNNVWIASSVIILPGVIIGNNVVIAAGSVVTKSIGSNSVVGGVPAKVIKVIFDEKNI